MSEITVVARAKAKPGSESALEQALRTCVGPTHGEDGCLRYALHKSVDDPRSFVVIERWVSKEALDGHLISDHVQELFKKVPNLVEAPPEIQVFRLLPEGQPEKGGL